MQDPVSNEVPLLDLVNFKGHFVLVEVVTIGAFIASVSPSAKPLLCFVDGPACKVIQREVIQAASVVESPCKELHAEYRED